MAKNRDREVGRELSLAPTSAPGTTALSGDPVLVGQIPGVALKDASDLVANGGTTSIQFDGVFKLSVKGIDAGGNSAVAPGDILYYVAADTPRLSKKNTGVRFGYALEVITSGATTTIRVKVGY
jgi:predicted RecA/RadA family phage recombinase